MEGPQPISLADVRAYMDIVEVDDKRRFLTYVYAMDLEFRAYKPEKEKGGATNGN